ncbi:MAG: type II toxin-antitoxin system RelE/ParE family toxin [bacterium]|nr:type II toxin-antitoxin system RelE/ParE family toxin [bacterium]
MKLIWTEEALERLYSIEEFISIDSPSRAERFVDFLIEKGENIAQNPNAGREVPEIRLPYIREIIVKKYRIVYKIKKNKDIDILTVFEGHKLLSIEDIDFDI